MAALFEITRRAAEAKDEKIAQALLGAGEVVGGVHGAEDFVVRNLAVEGGDEAGETVFADLLIDIGIVHYDAPVIDDNSRVKVRSSVRSEMDSAKAADNRWASTHPIPAFHQRWSSML